MGGTWRVGVIFSVVAIVHLDLVLKKKVKIPIHRESGGFETVMRFWSKIKKCVEYLLNLFCTKNCKLIFYETVHVFSLHVLSHGCKLKGRLIFTGL